MAAVQSGGQYQLYYLVHRGVALDQRVIAVCLDEDSAYALRKELNKEMEADSNVDEAWVSCVAGGPLLLAGYVQGRRWYMHGHLLERWQPGAEFV